MSVKLIIAAPEVLLVVGILESSGSIYIRKKKQYLRLSTCLEGKIPLDGYLTLKNLEEIVSMGVGSNLLIPESGLGRISMQSLEVLILPFKKDKNTYDVRVSPGDLKKVFEVLSSPEKNNGFVNISI